MWPQAHIEVIESSSPGYEPHFYCWLAVWSWAIDLASLRLKLSETLFSSMQNGEKSANFTELLRGSRINITNYSLLSI